MNHVSATLQDVNLNENGDIESILIDSGENLTADLFIDCSGFRSILLQQSLKVPFISFKENLFNDSAVAIPTELGEGLPSQTVSKALKHGWAWEIPLTNRYGNGYVYSSEHCSADEAEFELREELGILDSDVEARHLKMKVGRAEKSWQKNCVAIGLSQGFIEPLEATALQFVHSTIEEFIKAFEHGGFTNKHQATFNQRINDNFEGIRDYIVLHYKTNSRIDTDYWNENRENRNQSSKLKEMLETWHKLESIENALNRLNIGQYYTALSWNCLLAGVGTFPEITQKKQSETQVDLAFVEKFINGCSLNFGDHREVLMRA